MNDPRTAGGPVGFDGWSKPGMATEWGSAPHEESKGTMKCPVCGAEFEMKEPEQQEEEPTSPEGGM